MPRGIFGKNPHYEFRDRDPVFDQKRTMLKASGLSFAELSERTHMAASTFSAWFHKGMTISPRHESVQIFYRSFGIDYGVKQTLRIVVSNAKREGTKQHKERETNKKKKVAAA